MHVSELLPSLRRQETMLIGDCYCLTIGSSHFEEIGNALHEWRTIGHDGHRSVISKCQDGDRVADLSENVDALMTILQGQIDTRIPGKTTPTRLVEPDRPVFLDPRAVRIVIQATVNLSRLGVLPREMMLRVVRGSLLVTRYRLPRSGCVLGVDLSQSCGILSLKLLVRGDEGDFLLGDLLGLCHTLLMDYSMAADTRSAHIHASPRAASGQPRRRRGRGRYIRDLLACPAQPRLPHRTTAAPAGIQAAGCHFFSGAPHCTSHSSHSHLMNTPQ